ncbi:hypothetical protein LZK73_11845 [Neorhizobium galegae]|nr:hypothetical protein LZK73_11845 [Neorhizobium galegae]
MKTFVEINDTHTLQTFKVGGDDTVFSDTIEFQTTLNGNVNPKITLNPVRHGLSLSEAGLTNTYKRRDSHQVIVLLVFKPPVEAESAPAKSQKPKTPAPVRPSAANSNSLKQDLSNKLLQRQFLNLGTTNGIIVLPR